MKLSDKGELALVETLRKKFRPQNARVVLGIGDDCAVVRGGSGQTLLTTDMMVEGIHFDLDWMTPFQLGFKLVSVNVSDIYAMGGKPEVMLIGFAAPGDTDLGFFRRLFDGIQRAADLYRVTLAGGDITASEKIVLSAAVTGSGLKVLLRRGARVGDVIYVTGTLGDAACGLALLKKKGEPVEIEKRKKAEFGLEWGTVRPLIERQLMPRAVDPERFARAANSMMDISDGLLLDLSRLCKESRTGAVVYKDRVPLSGEMRVAAEHLGADPYSFALSGGEDYQLLYTAPKGRRVPGFPVGEIVSSGLEVLDERGRKTKVVKNGYRHYTN